MSRVRLVLFSLLVMSAVGAIASASASAAMPAYANESGTVLTTQHLGVLSLKLNTTSNAVLKGTLAGVKVTIECEEEHGTGTINNLNTMGESTAVVHYLKCNVTVPENQNCLVQNHLVIVNPTKDLLSLLEGSYRDAFSPETGTTFTSITIEKCNTTALNNTFAVEGTATALINNATSSLEFTKTSGSELTFGGNTATYTDTIQALMTGGGKIGVVNGS
jgi:hypothetical protein